MVNNRKVLDGVMEAVELDGGANAVSVSLFCVRSTSWNVWEKNLFGNYWVLVVRTSLETLPKVPN